jgi:hypothetical protein
LAGDSTITKLLPVELGSFTATALVLESFAMVDFRLAIVLLAAFLVVLSRRGFSYSYVVHASDLFDLSLSL